MKKFLQVFSLTLIVCAQFFSLVPIAKADGMIIEPMPYGDWKYGEENSQKVFISYENGRESMLIAIDTASSDNQDQIWIFPVPSKPEKVVIDNITQMPRIRGEYLEEASHKILDAYKYIGILTQTYPILLPAAILLPMMFFEGLTVKDVLPSEMLETTGTANEYKSTVQVYEHLNKNGMITELLTTENADDLYEYLQGKNVKIEKGELPVMDKYMGKDYSFVATWMSDSWSQIPDDKMLPNKSRGLLVSFPTNELYFPLIPTSVYESKIVPISIYVKGHVNPKIFEDIESYSEINYLINGYYYPAKDGNVILEDAWNKSDDQVSTRFYDNGYVDYTEIKINAPSKLLSEDLWISNNAPASIWGQKIIVSAPFLWGLLGYIISSLAISLLLSLLIFKESRSKNWWKYMLLGLFNLTTIIPFMLIMSFIKTKSIKEEDKKLFKAKGYSLWAQQVVDWRKIIYLLLFAVLFVTWSVISIELVKIFV